MHRTSTGRRQLVTHHTSNGCNLQTATSSPRNISGPTEAAAGCSSNSPVMEPNPSRSPPVRFAPSSPTATNHPSSSCELPITPPRPRRVPRHDPPCPPLANTFATVISSSCIKSNRRPPMATPALTQTQSAQTTDFLPLKGTDHVEFYVGTPPGCLLLPRSLRDVAGCLRWPRDRPRDRASYVLQQGKFASSSPPHSAPTPHRHHVIPTATASVL